MGINGYVLKDEAIEKLVEAVHTVYDGETWFSQKIIKKILNLTRGDKQFIPSEREIEILKLVKQGLTYEEIGQILSISHRTVRFHVSNIQDKLDAKNRIDALTKAVEKGWI
jgi:DNA-binding NarL/FixJ family response regulator